MAPDRPRFSRRDFGRIVNITVSPGGLNQQPRLLNYLTTPHLLVWSAVLASCSVPGLFPPVEIDGPHDYLTEIHPQAQAFVRSLADRLERGAAFFIDYGFTERECYHPQRHMGTLMCHRGHMADGNPLADVGRKDITAHVDFSNLALAAQEAGLPTLGFASQARFLMNCGIVEQLAQAPLQERIAGQRLINEHEMGELFKVIGFYKGSFWDAVGFREGDRTHTL